jgi:methionyl-tRNA formyltransferase
LSRGSYYGGRKPEDGRIDWSCSAAEIHNLIRGVAPPYPGAFTDVEAQRVRVLRSMLAPSAPKRYGFPALYCEAGRCYAQCGDGSALRILSMEVDGTMLDEATFQRIGSTPPVPLTHPRSARPRS